MVADWLTSSLTEVWLVVVSAVVIWAATVILTRMVGARSFSKMSSFDFAITVAIGSIIAAIATSASSIPVGVTALASLFAPLSPLAPAASTPPSTSADAHV